MARTGLRGGCKPPRRGVGGSQERERRSKENLKKLLHAPKGGRNFMCSIYSESSILNWDGGCLSSFPEDDEYTQT